MTRIITAKYPGRCANCGREITPGTVIYWDSESKAIAHKRCPKSAIVSRMRELRRDCQRRQAAIEAGMPEALVARI